MKTSVVTSASKSVLGAVLCCRASSQHRPERKSWSRRAAGSLAKDNPRSVRPSEWSLGAVRPELELAWARRALDRRAATPSEPSRHFPGARADLPAGGDGRRIDIDVPRRGSAQAGQDRSSHLAAPVWVSHERHVNHHQGSPCSERTPRPASKREGAPRSGSAARLGCGPRPRTSKSLGRPAIFTAPREAASSTPTCCVISR